jgi:hypothetical protein
MVTVVVASPPVLVAVMV